MNKSRFEFYVPTQDLHRHRVIAQGLGISLGAFYRIAANCFIDKTDSAYNLIKEHISNLQEDKTYAE